MARRKLEARRAAGGEGSGDPGGRDLADAASSGASALDKLRKRAAQPRRPKIGRMGAAAPPLARPAGPQQSTEEDRSLVEYADQEPSAFSSMLGGLIEANVKNSSAKEADFDALVARVGIFVTDIDEGVTLDFKGGRLVVHNGLKPRRTLTILAEADTVMNLSNLRIGPLGMPVYFDEVGRGVAFKLLRGQLKIDGLLPNILTLNAVTRVFSVQ